MPSNTAPRPTPASSSLKAATPAPAGPGPSVPEQLDGRLLEAVRRSIPKLPDDMREAVAALVSPENAAVTAAVLAAWAGSHAFGVGEVVDVGLLALGVIALGTMAAHVGKLLTEFVRLAATARTSADLDAAADRFADAVTILGVTLLSALVAKGASRVPGVASRLAAPVTPRFYAKTAEEWLYLAGFRRVAPTVRQGAETAVRFFEGRQSFVRESDAVGWLRGMDLSKPVGTAELGAGRELIGYLQVKPEIIARLKAQPKDMESILASLRPADFEMGRFFTQAGTSMDRLGIGTQNRVYVRVRFPEGTNALVSTAAPIKDTWTVRGYAVQTSKKNYWSEGQHVGGGGVQYLVPEARYLYYTKGLKITATGSRVAPF